MSDTFGHPRAECESLSFRFAFASVSLAQNERSEYRYFPRLTGFMCNYKMGGYSEVGDIMLNAGILIYAYSNILMFTYSYMRIYVYANIRIY